MLRQKQMADLTELSDVCEALHIWLLQDLQFLRRQSSLGVVFPLSWWLQFSVLIDILSGQCSLVLSRRVQCLSRSWRGILLSLLSQWATGGHGRFVQDAIIRVPSSTSKVRVLCRHCIALPRRKGCTASALRGTAKCVGRKLHSIIKGCW